VIRDAGVRPHRRSAFGGLRRLFRQRRQGTIEDAGARLVITADGGWRGAMRDLKRAVDTALGRTVARV